MTYLLSHLELIALALAFTFVTVTIIFEFRQTASHRRGRPGPTNWPFGTRKGTEKELGSANVVEVRQLCPELRPRHWWWPAREPSGMSE